mmetsp:Transcript_12979/g.20578  ORF Transcript_12979/g.20578 Transcript_12979/m.20578 type:complete len:109 (+) Transcript_12979:1135-1461(+)
MEVMVFSSMRVSPKIFLIKFFNKALFLDPPFDFTGNLLDVVLAGIEISLGDPAWLSPFERWAEDVALDADEKTARLEENKGVDLDSACMSRFRSLGRVVACLGESANP